MEAIKMSENENIKKAEEELEYLTGDEETRRLAYLREKAIRDEKAAIAQARDEGKAEGLLEGKAEGKKQIAKKMLVEGLTIESIVKITELTKEDIEKL